MTKSLVSSLWIEYFPILASRIPRESRNHRIGCHSICNSINFGFILNRQITNMTVFIDAEWFSFRDWNYNRNRWIEQFIAIWNHRNNISREREWFDLKNMLNCIEPLKLERLWMSQTTCNISISWIFDHSPCSVFLYQTPFFQSSGWRGEMNLSINFSLVFIGLTIWSDHHSKQNKLFNELYFLTSSFLIAWINLLYPRWDFVQYRLFVLQRSN